MVMISDRIISATVPGPGCRVSVRIVDSYETGPVSLWEQSMPLEVKEFAEGLAALGRVLGDPELPMVIVARFR